LPVRNRRACSAHCCRFGHSSAGRRHDAKCRSRLVRWKVCSTIQSLIHMVSGLKHSCLHDSLSALGNSPADFANRDTTTGANSMARTIGALLPNIPFCTTPAFCSVLHTVTGRGLAWVSVSSDSCILKDAYAERSFPCANFC
jgi:hypothetical protein